MLTTSRAPPYPMYNSKSFNRTWTMKNIHRSLEFRCQILTTNPTKWWRMYYFHKSLNFNNDNVKETGKD
jgi:hypothetical protein